MPTSDSTIRGSGFHYDPETGVCYRTLDFLGFPGYRVGDDGSVWTRKKTGGYGFYEQWTQLKPSPQHSGHLRVLLMPGRKHSPVYHLVLLAFVGPRPPGMQCRHFPDRDPANNHVENLRWGTCLENQQDRKFHGTNRIQVGTKNVMAKLDETKVREIRVDYATGNYTMIELGKKHNICAASVCLIVNRKLWGHVT